VRSSRQHDLDEGYAGTLALAAAALLACGTPGGQQTSERSGGGPFDAASHGDGAGIGPVLGPVAGDAGGADAAFATTSEGGVAEGAADAGANGGVAGPQDGARAADAGAAGCPSPLGGGPTPTTATHLDIGVHDPSMIWNGSLYYLFATGGTLAVRSSPDMQTWTAVGNVFSAVPGWITTALGANPGSLWAPDISYFNGQFHVYYAGSTFGSNTSVIGLATNVALDAKASQYSWVDQGSIVQSTKSDDFNAIDPSVSYYQQCAPWLAYGSFWSGIKLHKLDASTGHLATDDGTTFSIASRNGGAIEAASIVSHNGYFYLFVSFDACCKGVNSTYRTMVGRSTGSITGPYTDKAGAGMMQGAAEQLLATSGRYIGPGGGTAWKDGDTYLYAYHYYDGDDNGVSKLQVRPIAFDANDWIVLGDPLFP
jgi:arabinan endo-1,5-alpha-L-arabinosidase